MSVFAQTLFALVGGNLMTLTFFTAGHGVGDVLEKGIKKIEN